MTFEDIAREIEKTNETLTQVKNYLGYLGMAEGALNLSAARQSPLYSAVSTTLTRNVHLANTLRNESA